MKRKNKFEKNIKKKKTILDSPVWWVRPQQQRRRSDVEQNRQRCEWYSVGVPVRCRERQSTDTTDRQGGGGEKDGGIASGRTRRVRSARVGGRRAAPLVRRASPPPRRRRRRWRDCGGEFEERVRTEHRRDPLSTSPPPLPPLATSNATTTPPPVCQSRGDRRHRTRATFARTRRSYNNVRLARHVYRQKRNETHWRRVGTFENDFIRWFSRPHPTKTPTRERPDAAASES